MLQNTEYVKGGAPWLKKKDREAALIKESKVALGKEISKLRKISMRQLAESVKIPPSNMKYIEDGINAPSPEVYDALIKHLQPKPKQRKKMDCLYSAIRGAPPPDVCKIMIQTDGMNDVIRLLEGVELSTKHLAEMASLVQTFQPTTPTEKEQ